MAHANSHMAKAPLSDNIKSGSLILLGSILSYLVGVAGLLTLILTMAGVIPLGELVAVTENTALASLVNIGLLLFFALQHSVMARKSFKQWAAQSIPKSLERSLYVVASGIAILVMLIFWQPVTGVAWTSQGAIHTALWIGFVLGWGYLFAATFAINHFDLFGLRQAWFAFKNQPYQDVAFKENWMYRYSRHPIMLGALIGIWCVPTMTNSMLFLAIGMTIYVGIGLYFEERDLVRQWGQKYQDYRQRVGLLITLPGKK